MSWDDRPPASPRRRLLLAVVLAAVGLVACQADSTAPDASASDSVPAGQPGPPSDSPTSEADASDTPGSSAPGALLLHVAPQPAGRGDGSGWADAAGWADLPGLLPPEPRGGQVLLRADAGPYVVDEPLELPAGGTAGQPLVLQGVDASGGSADEAVFTGSRSSPYRRGGDPGGDLLRLGWGVDHVVVRTIGCVDVGVCVNVHGDVADLVLQDLTATNVRRLLDGHAPDDATASISGLTAQRITVRGFSKGVVRVEDDSSDVLVEDVVADSQRQDGDRFAMGVHLGGTAHDVVLRRVAMRNAQDTRAAGDYWNGDGFTTERGVHRVLLEDTVATGSTDGGYDLKSSETRLVRPVAADNKRNYRFWADDTVVTGCRGTTPRKRGGSGGTSQVHLSPGARVQLNGCVFVDARPDGVSFEVDEDARLSVRGGSVALSGNGTVEQTAQGGSVVLDERVRVTTLR